MKIPRSGLADDGEAINKVEQKQMIRSCSRLRAALAFSVLLLVSPLAHTTAWAEHGLEELKAAYTKHCEEARAIKIVRFALANELKQGMEKYWDDCSDLSERGIEGRSDYCFKLKKEVDDLFSKARTLANVAKKVDAECIEAQSAYSQALTEAALTKWLSGETGAEETAEFVRKQIGKKKTAKKKSAEKRPAKKKTARKPTQPRHSSSASAAVGIAIIGIVGGYLGSKAARKKSGQAPSSGRGPGGHHHPGSSYN